MQNQDDLATLFSRNLVLDPSRAQQQHSEQPRQMPAAEQPQITYSITQHYNHSAHIARQAQAQAQAQQMERASSEPAHSEYPAVAKILSSHGVDPSALSQSQLQLFKEADDAQKMRLLELWTIYPPTNSGSNPALAWNNTSFEHEEHLARMRHDQLQREQQAAAAAAAAAACGNDGPTMMSLDGTTVPVPFQGGDGRWLVDESSEYMMEPYMASGYESLSRREYEMSSATDGPRLYKPAMDPVYKSAHSPVDWATRQRAMENQYGSFTQCRMEY